MSDPVSSGYVGRSVLRREDRRLLTGRGIFVGDLELPGMLHAAIVRSPLAHARIISVDMSAAAAIPGVVLTVTGAELLRALPPVPEQQVALPNRWRKAVKHSFKSPRQPILAFGKGATRRRGRRRHRRARSLHSRGRGRVRQSRARASRGGG